MFMYRNALVISALKRYEDFKISFDVDGQRNSLRDENPLLLTLHKFKSIRKSFDNV